MKKQITEKLKVPSGVNCLYENKNMICKKGSFELSRKILIPEVSIKVENNEIHFSTYGTKRHAKIIKSNIAHIKNMFHGLDKKHIYKLEAVNVHFPMTLKVEGNALLITNFLGEKVPRKAVILPNVQVEVKGQHITVSSIDLEAAGQTAANFERATKLKGRDRRIFQDGIYITEKPGRNE